MCLVGRFPRNWRNIESGNARQEYIYDHRGKIIELATNDPAADEGSMAMVHYRYTYDVFGREIQSRIPNSETGAIGITGVDTTYAPDGSVVIQEIADDDGPASTKIQSFGQVRAGNPRCRTQE